MVALVTGAIALASIVGIADAAYAQQAGARPGVAIRGTLDATPPTAGAVAVPPLALPVPTAPPAAPAGPAVGRVQLGALLIDDGQRIENGLVWRVYRIDRRRELALAATERQAQPLLALPAGAYMVIASYGKAYISQRIDIVGGETKTVNIVMNAGGLRVVASIERGGTPSAGLISYDIFSDERDQSGERIKVVGGLRPGPVIRLNSGLYHLVSRLGDANATVSSDITVEAGKLSEARVIHQAAKVTFKLVERAGGEALADTQWVVVAGSGGIVKETAGALPTHMLAPGTYTVSAMSRGRVFQREFAVSTGDSTVVELVAR
jgi:hypothetical protein